MRILRFLLSLACLLAALVAGAKPRLVPIANAALVAPKSSNPGVPFKIGSLIYFAANNGIHGNELWRSDGTVAGTYRLTDIGFGLAGSDPTILGALGNEVLFQVHDSSPNESLWKSNGTVAGTVKIFTFPDRAPMNNGGYYVSVIPADSKAYIVVQQNYGGPNDLWVTDGTAAGTQRIGAFGISGSAAFGANGKLYFPAGDETVGNQFWVSDGTIPGTHMIQRSKECPAYTACGPLPTSLFRIGAQVYFGTATDGLWKTDGTPQGTEKVVQLANPSLYAASATAAYLGSDGKLWKTNGTAAGTTSTETALQSVIDLRVLDDGRLLYVPYGPAWDVWRSDGTPGGTLKLTTLPLGYATPGTYTVVPVVGIIGKRLFLTGWTAATGYELWLGDADTGSASLLKDLDTRVTTGPLSSSPGNGVEVGGKLLFAASDLRGRELWESDGSTAGTKLLVNIADEPGGGFVSGTVRAAGTAAPLAGVAVRLCAVGSACEAPTITDANGAYRFEGVIPGSYTLSAIRTGYVSQLYGGVQCPCSSTSAGARITVSSGFETSGVDFTLNPGGTISGTVKRLTDGTAVNAEVYILNEDFDYVDRVYSGAGGAYRSSSSLASGTYYVEARPRGLFGPINTVPQRFRGVDCGLYGCEGSEGEPVSVVAGSETSGIDFPLNSYGSISGTVRDTSNGATLPNAQVEFIRVNPEFYTSGVTVTTDADGHYQSPLLNPGQYYVLVGGAGFPSVYYPNQDCSSGCTPAASVTVSVNANTSGIDFSLTPRRARITGILRDSAGAPFPNMRVLAKPAVPRDDFHWADAYTDANGRYTFSDLPSGSYHLWALDEYYPHIDCSDFNYCDRSGATAVVATEGQTTTLDFALLSRPVTLTGRLLDSVTGTSIPGNEASLYVFDQAGRQVYLGFYGAASYFDGNYSVTVVTRATSFYLTASLGAYHRTAYPAVKVVCPPYTACGVPAGAELIPASSPTGKDIRLARYGSISGTVVNARTGNPVPNINVVFTPVAGGQEDGASTDSLGRYQWQRGEGTYYVRTSEGQGMQAQVYRDRNCSGDCVPSSGDVVHAEDGVDATGIDFHLQERSPTGKISGRVIDAATGLGIADAYVSATNTTNSSHGGNTRTDAQGYYTLENSDWIWGMTSGNYTMYVQAAGGYYLALSGGSHCPDPNACNLSGGSPVTVTGPNTTTGVNFQMVRLILTSVSPAEGSVSGGTSITITGANFSPQATVKVGGRPATITSISPTRIVALTPVGLEGPAHVTVTLSTSLFSSLAHAYNYTPVVFTDPTLAALTRVKRAHIDELRSAIKYLRSAAALPPFTFTDSTLTGKPVRTHHLLELRTALDEARTALGRPKLTYTNTLTPGTTKIKAVDVMEIRNGLR